METTSEIFSLKTVLNDTPVHHKKSKVVCTIGPACANVDKIVEMLDAGMDIARLNFSHGDHEVHQS